MKKRNFIKTSLLGTTAILVSGKAKALEYYPRPSGKKWAWLITRLRGYFKVCGNLSREECMAFGKEVFEKTRYVCHV